VVLPPAVAGLALLLALGRKGPLSALLDAWGLAIPFTPTAVVMAGVFVSAPLYLQSALVSFRRMDEDLLWVARSLGASPARAFFRIALPLCAPGLAGGAAIAWARSLGEFGATLMFAGNLPGHTQTLPLAIYAALQTPGGEALVLRLAGISVLLSLAALIASELIARRAGRGLHVL
jgi:molybdate transport system permease protein